jgi:hypothetical protein
MFLELFTLVPIQSSYFKAKKSGVTADNRIPLDFHPLANPSVRQITFAFTLFYKTDESFVNCVIVMNINLVFRFITDWYNFKILAQIEIV